MLGFVAAIAVEAATGKNVIQQAQAEPLPIAAISILFIVASIIPIVRGVPRRGNSIFTADAELWNGRLVSCPDYCRFAASAAQPHSCALPASLLAVHCILQHMCCFASAFASHCAVLTCRY